MSLLLFEPPASCTGGQGDELTNPDPEFWPLYPQTIALVGMLSYDRIFWQCMDGYSAPSIGAASGMCVSIHHTHPVCVLARACKCASRG